MRNVNGKFNEGNFEEVIIELLKEQGYDYEHGPEIHRQVTDTILTEDLFQALYMMNYEHDITEDEIHEIIKQLTTFNTTNLYEINKSIYNTLLNGIKVERNNDEENDFIAKVIDFDNIDNNIFKVVNQFELKDFDQLRIPDVVVFINGLPLVVFELKNVTNEDTTIEDAYEQLTIRYKRDIPSLFYYNAFIVISDGSNNRYGSFFSSFEHFYAWRLIEGTREEKENDGIYTLYTMVKGLFNKERLIDVIKNFIIFHDKTNSDVKIVARYPQYYGTKKLTEHIKNHLKPEGDGKGGTYFGATGCGKSYTMVFLAHSLMTNKDLKNPTLVYITDRNDLDEQLSQLFLNSKGFIGDSYVKQIDSRDNLKEELGNRKSGGVFITTIQKFSEGLDVLSDRNNIICISDEAHRSQTNLDMSFKEVKDEDNNAYKMIQKYGFAKYLRDSFPNATYVGFTGTPIDTTLDVFGEIVDSYDMIESVKDGLTVSITYEGRASKIMLDHKKVEEIEEYYSECVAEGANIYQVEESKKSVSSMEIIIGDEDRIKDVAQDFIEHYEKRVNEGATVKGKAMFVCMNRTIAYKLYKEITRLRPEWSEKRPFDPAFPPGKLSTKQQKDLQPIEKIKLVLTRNQDDDKELYDLAGTKEYRQQLAKQFKNSDSNFKIAIIVDMWLTGFDVPSLDTMYIDKPLQKHTLIQTISRVNRTYEGKSEGLVVDYIGIKSKLNEALNMFTNFNNEVFKDIELAVKLVKDQLDVLNRMYHKFNATGFYGTNDVKRLETLNEGVEYAQQTKEFEKRFMENTNILKSAYNLCLNSGEITIEEKQQIHFYTSIRSVIYKMIHGNAPSPVEINEKVRQMLEEAIKSQGVEQLYVNKQSVDENIINLLSDANMDKVNKLPFPNTKVKILERLLKQVINGYKKVNKIQSMKFSERLEQLIKKYEERHSHTEIEEVIQDMRDLAFEIMEDYNSFKEMGLSFEEKAFYDVLIESESAKKLMKDEVLKQIASEILDIVKSNTRYVDWNKREDIKAEMRMKIRELLDKYDYPPDAEEKAIKNVIEQVESFKKYN
jgi:type I restriction enzyme, R subunit